MVFQRAARIGFNSEFVSYLLLPSSLPVVPDGGRDDRVVVSMRDMCVLC